MYGTYYLIAFSYSTRLKFRKTFDLQSEHVQKEVDPGQRMDTIVSVIKGVEIGELEKCFEDECCPMLEEASKKALAKIVFLIENPSLERRTRGQSQHG